MLWTKTNMGYIGWENIDELCEIPVQTYPYCYGRDTMNNGTPRLTHSFIHSMWLLLLKAVVSEFLLLIYLWTSHTRFNLDG